ncbi:hypothetical protein IPL68_07590 [Candidatus Saccharibacteria bacterium]|nr:MAG: hypothetical protein IPL68_07590 [Candidatus Saccharibacteria bacterium]
MVRGAPKINRLAWQHLRGTETEVALKRFPRVRQILTFEGSNGPDAIKRKTPAQDEPWHYYDPYDPADTKLLDIIAAHYNQLVAAISSGNDTRASFEAAWLAHAVVDGLTPAHHYPYEQELKRLRKGQGIETRRTPKEKLMMPGDTVREKMHNNWSMWGDKGLLATHIAFEAGIALLVLPMRYRKLGLPQSYSTLTGSKPYLLFLNPRRKR